MNYAFMEREIGEVLDRHVGPAVANRILEDLLPRARVWDDYYQGQEKDAYEKGQFAATQLKGRGW